MDVQRSVEWSKLLLFRKTKSAYCRLRAPTFGGVING